MALEAALPPMPRRQSCDRCHEQKVRCVNNVKADGIVTLGGIAEEDETNLGGHVVSAVPCARCQKAGTVCVYSPQLRSGRPRLHRDSSAPPPRKRTRRVSRCSSSPSQSPTWPYATSPPSSSRPSTAVTYHAASIGLGIVGHPHEAPFHEHNTPQPDVHAPRLPSPGTTSPPWEQTGQHRSFVQAPPTSAPWMMSPFSLDGNQFCADVCQVPCSSGAALAPAIQTAPLFALSSETISTQQSSPRSSPWTSPNQLVDTEILEELAQINLRIHFAGRTLTPLAGTSALLSSPAVNSSFDAACSLVNLVDRYVSSRPLPSSRPPSNIGVMRTQRQAGGALMASFGSACPGVSPAIDNALDSSISLLIHACHQALLGIFEELSIFFVLCLTSPTQTGPQWSTLHPSNAQVMVMTNLINNLLSQLDRAISSLLDAPFSLDGAEQTTGLHTIGLDQGPQHEGFKTMEGRVVGHHEFPALQTVWREKATASLFDEIRQRQGRVRDQIRAVEQLSNQPVS